MIMKRILAAAILCGLILTAFAGCAEPSTESVSNSSTIMADGSSNMQSSDDSVSEPVLLAESSDTGTNTLETQLPVEEKESLTESSSPEQTSESRTPAQTEEQKPAPSSPAPAEPPKQEPQPTKPPSQPTEPAKPTEPEPPQETEKPTEPPAPDFDINHWISYAKNYAEGIGLELDSEAVECWDNPITAGTESLYIQRDIESRLNRYNRDEDITAVWIWAEQRADGDYDLYIGYA